jgi:hypothetical protein
MKAPESEQDRLDLISDLINRFVETGKMVVSALTVRRDTAPLNSVEALERFVSGRSAFVTQKKLYGYLKTRMGTKWPTVFADDVYRQSINIAAAQIFAASLSDLTIHAVATALEGDSISNETKTAIARRIFKFGIAENEGVNMAYGLESESARADFEKRLEGTDWTFGALRAENFNRSPAALLKWSPIADELKKFDGEIVENSMKFAWIDVRRDFAARLDAPAIVREVQAQGRGD